MASDKDVVGVYNAQGAVELNSRISDLDGIRNRAKVRVRVKFRVIFYEFGFAFYKVRVRVRAEARVRIRVSHIQHIRIANSDKSNCPYARGEAGLAILW